MLKREKITLYVILGFIVLFIVEINPEQSMGVAQEVINKKFGINSIVNLNFNFISTAILVSIFVALLKYFQLCTNIERQYDYIHRVEEKLNDIAEDEIITKEGNSYLNNYPLLSAFIHRIYFFVMPISILLLMGIKIYYFVYTLNVLGFFLSIVNISVCILIMIITFLYVIFIYKNNSKINEINKAIRKLLNFFKIMD